MSAGPLQTLLILFFITYGCAQRRSDVYNHAGQLPPSAEEQAKMAELGCERGGNLWDGKQCLAPAAFCQTHPDYRLIKGQCLSPQAFCEQKADGSRWVQGKCLEAHDACANLAASGYEWIQGRCLDPKEACHQKGFGSKWDDVTRCQPKGFLEICQDAQAPQSYQESITVLKSKAEGKGCLETRDWLEKQTVISISEADQPRQFQELATLQEFTQLQKLTLSNQWISSSAPLKTLVNLTTLDLQRNNLQDIDAVKYLTKLQELHVADNFVTDLSAVKDLKTLTVLSLSNNRISDLGPLSGLTSLTTLYVNGNAISNLGPLKPLVALQSLQLDTTPIATGQIKKDSGNCPTSETSQVLTDFCLH